jgi:hypothetical protein
LIWPFRKSPTSKIDSAWWQAADAAAEQPASAAIDALATSSSSAATTADERERQEEMLAGLRELADIVTAAELPVLSTQHRVIGADRCHFIAPVSLEAEAGGAGKLFLTSARLVFIGGRVRAWPWHRVRKVSRAGRSIIVVVAGEGEDLLLQCNTYGEALAAEYVVRKLTVTRP